MKIAIAAIQQETNSFSHVRGSLKDFEAGYLLEGNDILKRLKGTQTEMGAFIDRLETHSGEVVPIIAAWAYASGPMLKKDFDKLSSQLIRKLREQECDGILLSLHGAMLVGKHSDGEALLFKRLRKLYPKPFPIGCTLDWHANVTKPMLVNASFIVGYKTYPHQDLFATGKRAADLMIDRLNRGNDFKLEELSLPHMIHVLGSSSTKEPMRGILKDIRVIEKVSGKGCASIFCPHPWLDTPEFNTRLMVYHRDSDGEQIRRHLNRISHRLKRALPQFNQKPKDFKSYLRGSQPRKSRRPKMLVDTGDIVLAGSDGRQTHLLQQMLDHAPEIRSCIPLLAPEWIAKIKGCRRGDIIPLRFAGMKLRNQIRAKVIRKNPRPYRWQGAYMNGLLKDSGMRIRLEIGKIDLILCEKSDSAGDPAFYTSMGIDLHDMEHIVVKSHHTFKPAYRDISKNTVYISTPGPTNPNVDELPYKYLPSKLIPKCEPLN